MIVWCAVRVIRLAPCRTAIGGPCIQCHNYFAQICAAHCSIIQIAKRLAWHNHLWFSVLPHDRALAIGQCCAHFPIHPYIVFFFTILLNFFFCLQLCNFHRNTLNSKNCQGIIFERIILELMERIFRGGDGFATGRWSSKFSWIFSRYSVACLAGQTLGLQ